MEFAHDRKEPPSWTLIRPAKAHDAMLWERRAFQRLFSIDCNRLIVTIKNHKASGLRLKKVFLMISTPMISLNQVCAVEFRVCYRTLNMCSIYITKLNSILLLDITPTYTLYKDQTTTPGTPCPTLYNECVGFLTSPANNVKMQGTGPTVYRPYLRRLEYLSLSQVFQDTFTTYYYD